MVMQFLDVADKLASVGAFGLALILFVRELQKGNEAQKRAESDHFQHPKDDSNSLQPFHEPMTRAEAFEQHRNFKEGMYLPAPLFVEAYQYKRRIAMQAIVIGTILYIFFALNLQGSLWLLFSIFPLTCIGGGVWLMRKAANQMNRRFPH